MGGMGGMMGSARFGSFRISNFKSGASDFRRAVFNFATGRFIFRPIIHLVTTSRVGVLIINCSSSSDGFHSERFSFNLPFRNLAAMWVCLGVLMFCLIRQPVHGHARVFLRGGVYPQELY